MAGFATSILAAATGDTPTAGFTQSVDAVQSYSALMAAISMTGEAGVDPALTTAKTHAAQWYDTIYPTYLDMPSTIASQGPQIDSGLSVLTQLAAQLATSDTPAIRASINSEAASLQSVVSGIGTQVQGLATSLQTFATNLQSDVGALGSAQTWVTSLVQTLQQQLAGLYGQLQHLQNATCPSQADINACQQIITTTTTQLQDAESAGTAVAQAQQGAGGAASGLSYLTGYWSAVGSDAGACVSALATMQTDPSSLLAIDLQTTQQLWTTLKSQFEGISAQILA